MTGVFIIVFSILNVLSFLLMSIDKYKAIHKYWRIREKTFFILAAIGGSIGVLFGMYILRHKTRHMPFVIGIPIIIMIQFIIILYIVKTFDLL